MSETNVTVDISDYLSKDEMRNIFIEVFRDVARRKAAADFQRIMDNAAYELVRREVDAVFDVGMAATIKEKAVSVIDSLSASTVFKKADAWDREDSIAWKEVQNAMRAAAPDIHAKVNAIVASMDESFLRDLIEGSVSSAIIAKLRA